MVGKKSRKPKSGLAAGKLPLPFRQAVVTLNLLGSLWRTAIAAAVMLTITLISIGQMAYVGMTFNGGNAFFSIMADSYVFGESLKGLIMFVIAFFIYDAMYVAIANRYAMRQSVDKGLLLTVEGMMLAALLLTSVIQAAALSYGDWRMVIAVLGSISLAVPVTLLSAVVLVSVRAVLGVSWTVSRVQVKKRA